MVIERRTIPSSETTGRKRKASTTPEGRESKMISLAERLAERQLEDGSASAQVITHYLKLGSTRERLEQQRLAGELDLQKAKIEQMASTGRLEEMYNKAINALRGYQGNFDDPDSEENHGGE
jgi:hypothetical protein